MTLTARILRALGPAVARPPMNEMLRGAVGAGLGLFLTALLLSRALHGNNPSPALIAPLGATAFLLFLVPNSPLSQPWSAVIGNFTSAIAALVVIRVCPDPVLAAALAVSAAVLAMMIARAMHPPGAAVALLIALSSKPEAPVALSYAFSRVLPDTMLLVLVAILFNRATGRTYPFRQPPTNSNHGTRDTAPERRLGLSPHELATILSKMNLAANIGAEDLARVIGVAEAEATSRHLGGLSAADVMSRDVVTIGPDRQLDDLAAVFQQHRFKTLPVVAADATYLGLLSQSDLLGRHDPHMAAGSQMATTVATATPDTSIARLLALLADGKQQSVPILDSGRLVGLVTRSDMLAALSRAFVE